jgi:hypothetical protein
VCLYEYVFVCHFCFTWPIFTKRDVNGLPVGDHQKCSTSKFFTTSIRKTQACVSWMRRRNCMNAPRGSLLDGDNNRVIGATMWNLVRRWVLNLPTRCVRNIVCELATEDVVTMLRFGVGSYSRKIITHLENGWWIFVPEIMQYALCLAVGVSCNIYTDAGNGLITATGIFEEVKRWSFSYTWHEGL